jgi:predicted PurR-regulated permease PerM
VWVIAGLSLVIGVTTFLRDLPTYQTQLEDLLAGIATATGGSGAQPLVEADLIGQLVRSLAEAVPALLTLVGYSVLVVAYLLLDAPNARARARWAFGPDTRRTERAADLADRLRAYVVARAALGALAAALDTILLILLGVPAALLWGVLSFLLSFVPNVGFILALIPPAVLGLLTGGPLVALAVVIGYSVINVAIDYVVQPSFIGGSVDLSAVVITLSLVFWVLVMGPVGAILGVPLTIVMTALFEAFDETRPLARLLAQRVPSAPEPDPSAA